jgi:biopolymer transport protein ExbB
MKHPVFQSRIVGAFCAAMLASGRLASLHAQEPPQPAGLLEVFNEQLADGLNWSPATPSEKSIRTGGFESENYLYLRGRETPVSITGLSIPIRENPGPGEYRFMSFAWRKWGEGSVSLTLDRDPAQDGGPPKGAIRPYGFTAADADDASADGLLRVSSSLGSGWQGTAVDLWKEFGDFTITGFTLTATSRDLGLDALAFARQLNDFNIKMAVFQPKVTESVEVKPLDPAAAGESAAAEAKPASEVKVDWAAQIKAGGIWMYPLYLCAVFAVVIATQRLLTVNETRLAPAALRKSVKELTDRGDFEGALNACDRHTSTLADVFRFILRHRHGAHDMVNQTAGDIAARDIRAHLGRIYPLSVISSLSPLLGLLGTVIGMVEAFGIVALYGDEGGAGILSDSISKALITTAAGLIIAIPSISIYFILKNRIMRFASVIEVEVENLVTDLYLGKASGASQPDAVEPGAIASEPKTARKELPAYAH